MSGIIDHFLRSFPGRSSLGEILAALAVVFCGLNVFSAHFANINDSVVASPLSKMVMPADTLKKEPASRHRMPLRHHDRPVVPDTLEMVVTDSADVAISALSDTLWVDPEDRAVVMDFPVGVDVDSDIVVEDELLRSDTLMLNQAEPERIARDVDPDYIVRDFAPDPNRAVWLSALCPGLGQLYNRRYWKLPLVVGGFMGLIYGYSWNNQMLQDYTQAYRDLMDNDPNTKSYMDFYPPNTDESTLNKTWLQKLMKSRKDFYRRNRDFCVIGMVGVYLVAMVDAYVDASLTHFDVSPDLSFEFVPKLMPDARNRLPGVGLAWVINF